MTLSRFGIRCSKAAAIALGVMVIIIPLAILFGRGFMTFIDGTPKVGIAGNVSGPPWPILLRTLGLSGGIAGVAVLLGLIPGRLWAGCRAHQDVLLWALLLPLVLPRYLLYYAWSLMLSPTTAWGQTLAASPKMAQWIGIITSSIVLTLWYWPLAAMILGYGWRQIDRQTLECASLDAAPWRRFWSVTVPLMAYPILLAVGLCWVLGLSEFATFHLAGVRTFGTELGVLYEMTGSENVLAGAAWPVLIVAAMFSIVLSKALVGRHSEEPILESQTAPPPRWYWGFLIFLLVISLGAPVGLLCANLESMEPLRQFLTLHLDEIGWSLLVAATAACLAYLLAWGSAPTGQTGLTGRYCSHGMAATLLLVMLIPASLMAVSQLKMYVWYGLPGAFRQCWAMVAIGLASRYAGLALIVIMLTRHARRKQLTEMACLDGASGFAAWWHVHFPNVWPAAAGSFLLIMMFSMTELDATMVLLPAGLPNFAQRLLNQMHYARDQQVITSCLVLIALFVLLTTISVVLLRIIRLRWSLLGAVVIIGGLAMTSCDDSIMSENRPKVVNVFGHTGADDGEFVYPRAIAVAGDETVFVADKTGRIQRFSRDGKFISAFRMPDIEAGKPTGMGIAPNGNLYVADTHYHRIMIFSPSGERLSQFGRFGREDGCFIYPTDVAFSGDGRIFVSEYGGNDRISVFTDEGIFRYAFGTPGSGKEQFSRPEALCADPKRELLYIADACNHRIAVYTYAGRWVRYIGEVGRDRGQLRYPYGLDLLGDGTLVVCEYGNNRIQWFSPEGESLAIVGRPGEQFGELAYPWSVGVDSQRQMYIVDAGNNRIQVWQP
jgi:ABC-type Fe3+ transport system permease subunit/sugar lactone lactonase YvrE